MPTPLGFSTPEEWRKKQEAETQDPMWLRNFDFWKAALVDPEKLFGPIIEKTLVEMASVLPGTGPIVIERRNENCSPEYIYCSWTNGRGAKITMTFDTETDLMDVLIDFEDPRDPSSAEMANVFYAQCEEIFAVEKRTRGGKHFVNYQFFED